MGFARGAAGVDDLHAVWFPCCYRQIGVADSPEKCPAFLLEAILIFVRALMLLLTITASGAVHGRAYFVVEQNSQIWLKVAA